MVKAKALKTINVSGEVTGYTLEDDNGSIMDIKSEAIIGAIQSNKLVVENLSIVDGKLVEKVQGLNTLSEARRVGIQKGESEKVNKMHELVDKLNKAREVYEQGHDEIMSNYEYDKLYDELLELEKELDIVLTNSPTHNVGYEVVSKLSKETHSERMLSLDKTKDKEVLRGFLKDKQGVLSWKLDGLTVVLTYENGELVKAVTRGNGEVGELVTSNAKQFKNIPRRIAFKNRLVLRGEAIIKYSDFEKINSNIVDEEKYKNPRNLCSGSVRQLDSKITAKRNINWYCFDLVECDCGNCGTTVERQLAFLKLLGFETVEHYLVDSNNFEKVFNYFASEVAGKNSDVPSDGLVLTFNDKEYGRSLGCTTKFPRHSLAFKWQDETAISTIEYIEWSPSRTGLINPVAVFKPVDIEGSTVSRASVHNVSIFSDLELGYGDRVSIYKANMIIPQVLDNLDRTSTCEIPEHCPCCGCETEIHEEPNSGVLTLWCPNDDCGAKGNRLMEHFVSRDAMNIEGISGSTLATLAEAGIITDLVSIYHIKEHEYDIINLDGFGRTSFMNMVNAIDKSRNIKVANLIYALGIPNVGLSTAKLICKSFGNKLENIVTAEYGDLIQIDGIGDVIAESFIDYFEDERNSEQFINLVRELNIVQEKVSEDTSMAGVTICVTGDVYIFPNRRVVKEVVENMGGKLTGSVSRSTTYLVTNDTTSGSRKNKSAQEYGIPILTEQEFIDKFNIKI